jgi:hypothetical protein
MPRPQGVYRLKLGPIVGHTDEHSTRIWIQVFDDPSRYALRVHGAGTFQFLSTEAPGPLEFRTAIAVATNLRPDWQYRYSVLRRGRVIANGRGSFRTMPDPTSMAPINFCVISCNKDEEDGAWKAFGKFVKESKPQFVLMTGDQLYLDEGGHNIFGEHRNSTPSVRRAAIAEKYRVNWSRDVVREVLANVPVYMMWDDHDIRDGWGSSPADSETMVAKYKRGRRIFEKCKAYFLDCRDAYWHFQACHNPRPSDGFDPALPNYIDGPPQSPLRLAMPYAFRCGRLVVLMLDSRGERDVFRDEMPILGARQWQFIDHVFANLPPDVEALAVMTPTPIASLDPHGQVQKIMGDRTDDIDAFKRGDEKNTVDIGVGDKWQAPLVILNQPLSSITRRLANKELNLGNFKMSNIDEARDQWSHKFSIPEQLRLLRGAGRARLANRTADTSRGLIFLSGDIHVGATFQITCSNPAYEAMSLTSSGISVIFDNSDPIVDMLVSEEFDVGPGIKSSLQELVTECNFGIVNVIPTGGGAEMQGIIAHEGNSFAYGVNLERLLL